MWLGLVGRETGACVYMRAHIKSSLFLGGSDFDVPCQYLLWLYRSEPRRRSQPWYLVRNKRDASQEPE